MSKTLTEIAQQLRDRNNNVQLIYAFNGVGKTRLSREVKELIAPKEEDNSGVKILYYNAFTEDLFYWDNDLTGDAERKLKIQTNNYTDWALKEQGQDQNTIGHFQHYTSESLTPIFNDDFSEVVFTVQRGNDELVENVKISKGEESCFIWSIFFSLLEQVIAVLNIPEVEDRETDQFNQLEYVFIDDPVTSLDENHLIELAVNLATLVKSAPSSINFIFTTHNPLFYNVLYNELRMQKKTKRDGCYLLKRLDDGLFSLDVKGGDSNKSFSYHLYLKQIIEEAIADNQVQKYHFMLLRNLYEKTANFLGHKHWGDLLPDDKGTYLKRVMNFASHSTLSNEVVAEPTPEEQNIVKFLLDYLLDNYGYWQEDKEQEEANA